MKWRMMIMLFISLNVVAMYEEDDSFPDDATDVSDGTFFTGEQYKALCMMTMRADLRSGKILLNDIARCEMQEQHQSEGLKIEQKMMLNRALGFFKHGIQVYKRSAELIGEEGTLLYNQMCHYVSLVISPKKHEEGQSDEQADHTFDDDTDTVLSGTNNQIQPS